MAASSATPPIQPLVARAFAHATANGSVLFTPTTRRALQGSVACEARLATALQRKPVQNSTLNTQPGASASTTTKTRRDDPFGPPDPLSLVGSLQGFRHNVVLNRFSVVRGHFLLTSREFESQFSPPSPEDLSAIAAIIAADHGLEVDPSPNMKRITDDVKTEPDAFVMRADFCNLFAFFNCGPVSGASVLHKHFQLLPNDTTDDQPINLKDFPPISTVVEDCVGFSSELSLHAIEEAVAAFDSTGKIPDDLLPIPFTVPELSSTAHAFSRIDTILKYFKALPGGIHANRKSLGFILRSVFERTLRAAVGSIAPRFARYVNVEIMLNPPLDSTYGELKDCVVPIVFTEGRDVPLKGSYENGFMSYNFICTPKFMGIMPRRQEKFMESISINSCGLGGMLLVKNEEQLALIEKHGLVDVLNEIAFPTV